MRIYNSERSFIAAVESNTPGFEGFWDCGELKLQAPSDNPNGPEVPHRRAANWLTISTFKNRQPHRFWFRCFEDRAKGTFSYDIQSWSRKTGQDMNTRQRHFYLNANGYVGLSDEPTPQEFQWQLATLESGESRDIGDDLKIGTLQSVDISSWRGALLTAFKRQDVGNDWYCYVAEAGGPVMSLTLDIQTIGEEYLDDN
jgi:hypothetical protein